MARFRDIRHTVTKRTPEDGPERLADVATPRRLSPYLPGPTRRPRPGVNPLDIEQPKHNRRSRREMGVRRTADRLPGVSLTGRPLLQTATTPEGN